MDDTRQPLSRRPYSIILAHGPAPPCRRRIYPKPAPAPPRAGSGRGVATR
jgi:hypothetical protein